MNIQSMESELSPDRYGIAEAVPYKDTLLHLTAPTGQTIDLHAAIWSQPADHKPYSQIKQSVSEITPPDSQDGDVIFMSGFARDQQICRPRLNRLEHIGKLL